MGAPYRVAMRRLSPWLLAVLGAGILLTATFIFIGSTGFGYDYLAYDSAARRLAAGDLLYAPGTAEAYNSGQYAGLYLYPPPLAVFLTPIAGLTIEQATLAWYFGRLVVLSIGIAIVPVRREVKLVLVFVAAVSFPVLYDLNLGNLSIVLFAVGAAIWRWNGSFWAGLLLSIASAVRYPFGLVGIGWILSRQFMSIAGSVAAGIVILITTLPIVGISGWVDYVTILRGLGDISTGPHNLSLGTTVAALGVGSPWTGLAVLIGVAGSVLAVGVAARRHDPELTLVVALAGTMLFGPFFHPHYLVALLIPAAYVANRGHAWGYALPLLGWLPGEVLGLVAVTGIVAPFLAGPPRSQVATLTSA